MSHRCEVHSDSGMCREPGVYDVRDPWGREWVACEAHARAHRANGCDVPDLPAEDETEEETETMSDQIETLVSEVQSIGGIEIGTEHGRWWVERKYSAQRHYGPTLKHALETLKAHLDVDNARRVESQNADLTEEVAS